MSIKKVLVKAGFLGATRTFCVGASPSFPSKQSNITQVLNISTVLENELYPLESKMGTVHQGPLVR